MFDTIAALYPAVAGNPPVNRLGKGLRDRSCLLTKTPHVVHHGGLLVNSTGWGSALVVERGRSSLVAACSSRRATLG